MQVRGTFREGSLPAGHLPYQPVPPCFQDFRGQSDDKPEGVSAALRGVRSAAEGLSELSTRLLAVLEVRAQERLGEPIEGGLEHHTESGLEARTGERKAIDLKAAGRAEPKAVVEQPRKSSAVGAGSIPSRPTPSDDRDAARGGVAVEPVGDSRIHMDVGERVSDDHQVIRFIQRARERLEER